MNAMVTIVRVYASFENAEGCKGKHDIDEEYSIPTRDQRAGLVDDANYSPANMRITIYANDPRNRNAARPAIEKRRKAR